jgi:hypothetical protein
MSENYPKPLWMERRGVGELFQKAGLRKPHTEDLLEEFQILKEGVEAGLIEWPPYPVAAAKLEGTTGEHMLDEMSSGPAIEKASTFMLLPSVMPALLALESRNHGLVSGIQLLDAIRQYWHQEVSWEAFGRQVYVLDPLTAEMLTHTDLPDIPFADLEAPLPAFYLALPEGTLPLTSKGIETEGLLVRISEPSTRPGRKRSIEVLGLPSPQSEREFFPVYTFFTGGANDPLPAVGSGGSGVDAEFKRAVLRAVFGFCLYLMTQHPSLEPVEPRRYRSAMGLKNPRKRAQAERDNKTKTRLGFVWVGRGELLGGEGPEEDGQPAGALRRAHWVRGHFRNQAHGAGHALRRLTWIRPHLRGSAAPSTDPRAQRVQAARQPFAEAPEPGR